MASIQFLVCLSSMLYLGFYTLAAVALAAASGWVSQEGSPCIPHTMTEYTSHCIKQVRTSNLTAGSQVRLNTQFVNQMA